MTGLRACINVESLPLQILLKAFPGWEGMPVAVTKEEKPQSPILALNGEARERGLAPGMRYANALSLVPNLRARAVPPDRVAHARDSIVRSLSAFTPDIEPCPFDMDAFWVSVDGLRSLFGTEDSWSQEVRRALKTEGYHAVVVVGFTRFGTYAIARSGLRSLVFSSLEEERAVVGRSPVDILPLPQRTKSTLRKLEIRNLARFTALPEGEIIRRFGKEAGILWKAIRSDDPLPVQLVAVRESTASRRHLDAVLVDLDLLMPHVDELLFVEAARAEAARSVIAGLTLVLRTEDGDVTTDLVRPAVPTLKIAMLRRLLLLRLSSRTFASGVEDIEIRCAQVPASGAQEELFGVRGRDLQAGAAAFAAIRARFGNDAVTCARLSDSWLPERCFTWVPIQRPALPTPRQDRDRDPDRNCARHVTAIRRIFFEPRPLDPRAAAVDRDPFLVSGSWWGTASRDAAFAREYSFRRSAGGTLWVYRDTLDGTDWVQGVVD